MKTKNDSNLIINVVSKGTWTNSFFRFNALRVTGIEDMVDKIISRAKEHGGEKTIFRLNIRDHGNVGFQLIGGEILNSATLIQWYPYTLSKLRPFFTSDGMVILHGCQVAKGDGGSFFLQTFSNIVGVPVRAGELNQKPFVPGMEGPVKECTQILCEYVH